MPDARTSARELLGDIERMTALARDGEWPRVESMAATLHARVGRLAAVADRDELAAAQAAVERLSLLARSARNEIGDQLKAIHHGRKATASYRTTDAR